ncbi:MAG: TonB-dependent receptor [Woeseiaceae bacterium]|nr:TonB-dependent receptor [Woeseiaceae bacterium]
MKRLLALSATMFLFGTTATAQEDQSEELAEITVTGKRVANTRPAGTYSAVATALRFDPITELQSRGLPEGQADVTVRGGLFENTGFRAGAVTVMDPQTGHYAAELPIDPDLLDAPDLLIGVDNAVAGFNSNIATVDYAFRKIEDGGSVLLGAGSDSLRFGSLQLAGTTASLPGRDVGYAITAAQSSGDGTVPNGDHDFERYNVHLQLGGASQQTDLLLSYQDKFYGWPGAYTGFASLPETDQTKTTLVLANHFVEQDTGFLELGAFYRGLEDDYDFDRTTNESGGPGSFDHETRVYGIGFEGLRRGARLDWRYAGQLTSDELVFSTDLVEGDFTTRDYVTASVVPTLRLDGGNGREVELQFGGTFDWSSRDGSEFSPVVAATARSDGASGSRFVALEYAATSQLPGYTVLNSPPAGLFGGNPDLGRETARQLSLAAGLDTGRWDGKVTLFYREDDDLVDWTFATGAPFARQANAVDIDVTGVELLGRGRWPDVDLVASYTYLDKDADYGSATVDASFYALNFATHRATLAVLYRFGRDFELRFDSEYRRQRDNPLRDGSDEAFLSSLAVAWEPAGGLGVALTADNLTDDDYQQFPGTPAVGRQVSLSVRYQW